MSTFVWIWFTTTPSSWRTNPVWWHSLSEFIWSFKEARVHLEFQGKGTYKNFMITFLHNPNKTCQKKRPALLSQKIVYSQPLSKRKAQQNKMVTQITITWQKTDLYLQIITDSLSKSMKQMFFQSSGIASVRNENIVKQYENISSQQIR